MALSSNIAGNKLTLTVFVAFVYFCTFPTSRADLIDDVCSQSQLDPGFCKTALRSDPRSRNADLWTLAQIGIDSAQSYTKSTISIVQSLQQGATDPEPKKDYAACLRNYDIVSNELLNCMTALKDTNYGPLNERAQASYDASSVCDSVFREPQAPEPENLKAAGLQVQTLCSTISYIAYKLQGL